ncbi:MAG: hypothetical protein O7F13_04450 [Gammaproteobacteria bacterium]|nr:hypothetical protein [Gammaproteobacteria bacterium]
MKNVVWIPILLILSGCAATLFTADRPGEYYQGSSEFKSENNSLFSSDTIVLSDTEIERILNYRYEVPPLNRVAILPFGWSVWSGWSEEMAVATEDVNEKLIKKLRASSKIYDASFLPSILIPEKRTVPYIREAAARYQADLVLVFRSACRSFQKYRFFRADKVRAYCSVEAVLLDVRSGLVPFVAVVTRNYNTEKSESDLNLRETILRSQLSAIADALEEVSSAIVGFLAKSGSAPDA